jgi:hypothetical protein
MHTAHNFFTITPTQAADEVEMGRPQRLLQHVELRIEVVDHGTGEIQITDIDHRGVGQYVDGDMLEKMFSRWMTVCHQRRGTRNEVRVVLKTRALERDVTYAVIDLVARYHAGADTRIGLVADLCRDDRDSWLEYDDDLIAAVVALTYGAAGREARA